MTKPVFAIDVGGVLANKHHEGPPQPGVVEILNELAQQYTLWVVSQCGLKRRLYTEQWLAAHSFPIPPERQIYVSFKETKTPMLSAIRANYFVDDRFKHVSPALAVPSMVRVFHFGIENLFPVGKYMPVASWRDIQTYLKSKEKIK